MRVTQDPSLDIIISKKKNNVQRDLAWIQGPLFQMSFNFLF